jgi:hypothetical protein
MPYEHEYHFFTNFTLWFHTLPVHIAHIRKNYLEWNKIVKYNIHIYIYVKFEHMLCMGVGWWSKKFGGLKLIFLILCRELYKSTPPRTLCREPVGRLSAYLTDGPTAVTAVPLCRELPPVLRACSCGSRCRSSVPWASFSAESLLRYLSTQIVCTVGSFCAESLFKNSRQRSLCREPVLWLTAQNFAHGTRCDSGSVGCWPSGLLPIAHRNLPCKQCATGSESWLGRRHWGPGASQWSMDDRSSVMSDWQRVLDRLLA